MKTLFDSSRRVSALATLCSVGVFVTGCELIASVDHDLIGQGGDPGSGGGTTTSSTTTTSGGGMGGGTTSSGGGGVGGGAGGTGGTTSAGGGGVGGAGGGAPVCMNGVLDVGTETDVDCGGTCPANCINTKICAAGTDCVSGFCSSLVCAACTGTGAGQCAGTEYCNAGVCHTKEANGTACTDVAQCMTGNCVAITGAGSVCCDGACTEGCKSCKGSETGGANGACMNVTAATDPKNACNDDCVTAECNGGVCSANETDGTACNDGVSEAGGECLTGGCVDCTTVAGCDATHVCVTNGCCTPMTMGTACAGIDCGMVSDGCGGMIACPDTCGTSLEGPNCTVNSCGCAMDNECGTAHFGGDCLPSGVCGCDATMDCNTSPRGKACAASVCGCTAANEASDCAGIGAADCDDPGTLTCIP